MSTIAFSFKKVRFSYPSHAPIFTDLHMDIQKNTYLGIIGNNGSGKTTLLKLVLGLLQPEQGSVINNIKHLAYIPQTARFDRTFPINIADMLKMARVVNKKASLSQKCLHQALEKVGLLESLDRPIHDLSGGQFQRILFARMLLINPDLLILDEPFNGIDEDTIEDLAAVLKSLHNNGKTIVLAIHDAHFLKTHVPDVLELLQGNLIKPEIL